MKPFLISIILPVYNAEEYIEECINSILIQTYKNFELLVINDGSTDNSINLIKSYNDQRIKIINNEHNFIKTLNLGLKHAEGKYIARMDGDDLMLPHRLEVQFNYMENNPEIDICGSWAESFGSRNNILITPENNIDIISNLLLSNSLLHPTIIMKRSSLCRYPKYPNLYKQKYLYAEDYKLWTEFALYRFKFANIPEVLLKYRCSDKQVTSIHKVKMMKVSHCIQIQYVQKVAEKLIEYDVDYYKFLNEAIEFVNNNKLHFNSLKIILADIYQRCLSRIS